jgi:hypothetical protein
VADTAIATEIFKSLDVALHLSAKVTLDRVIVLDRLSKRPDLTFSQILNLGGSLDARLLDDVLSSRLSDPVNIGQGYVNAFISRKVDTCYTCHNQAPSSEFDSTPNGERT